MYRILVNGCQTYRVQKLVIPEKDHTQAKWVLIRTTDKMANGGTRVKEFQSRDKAMAWIAVENEKPMWERKRNTWAVVEEVPSCEE
jgi:hypothetical protein